MRVPGSFRLHNIHTKFHQSSSNRSRFESCGQTDGQTDTVGPIDVNFVHIVQRIDSTMEQLAKSNSDHEGLKEITLK
jgi:hypothetical protein